MTRYRNSWGRIALTVAFLLPLMAMPIVAPAVRDGNGGYSLPSNSFSVPVTGGTLVASEAAAVWADITTAIAGSVAADGQTTMSGNLKIGGNKITGLAVGTANTDSVTLGQVQNSGMKWGGVAAGTADALTFALSPVITAYADGQIFFFVSSASPNTGAATLNVNSVGVKSIQKKGAALAANDIAASKVYAVTYYNNIFHLWSPEQSLAALAALASANTFTAAQAISVTAAGTALTATSTDAGAAQGPDFILRRDSATSAAADSIGNILWRFEDSAGTDTLGVQLLGAIIDPTDASEDGELQAWAMVGGSAVKIAEIGNGIIVGVPTGDYKGTGTLNAEAGLYVNGHGTVAQTVCDTETALVTNATAIPFDDTIPQNTEGVEVLLLSVTPTNASSTLYIDVVVQVGLSTTNTVTAALFHATDASAINAMGESVDATTIRTIKYRHPVSAASTAARNYSVRVGGASGTVSLNGIAGTTRRYGGVATSTLCVSEVLPQ